MWKRLLLWFKPKKGCSKCCMFCKYYDDCKGDFLDEFG